jgi:uncharacterized protein
MFKILSLDGGGIRGAFTAAALAEIEARLVRPAGDYFDLVAGTSTGGLIAAAVATGIPAARVVEFYQQQGPAVFTTRGNCKPPTIMSKLTYPIARFVSRRAVGLRFDDLLQTKYNATMLRKAVDSVFGDQLVGEITKCRLLVPAVDVTIGRTVVYKTPHLPGLTRDRHFKLAEILMATTAAPTYFPHATVNQSGAVVDGGLWANNPSLVAYMEAIKIRECADREFDPQFEPHEITVLSIGTGEPRYSLAPPDDRAGIGWWGPRVFNIASISQSQGTSFQLQYLLGERYRRLNYELPDDTWSLDSIDHIASLLHKGKIAAHDCLTDVLGQFCSSYAPDYVPFDDHGLPLHRISVTPNVKESAFE